MRCAICTSNVTSKRRRTYEIEKAKNSFWTSFLDV